MKVVVIFEFPEITDIDGPDANKIVSEITRSTTELERTVLWTQDYDCNVWIDEVLGD